MVSSFLTGRNFRNIPHKSRKQVPQNIEQPQKSIPQNFMVFQFKKTDLLNHL